MKLVLNGHDERYIVEALLDDPSALRTPIVRNGSKVTVGANEEEWKKWVEADGK